MKQTSPEVPLKIASGRRRFLENCLGGVAGLHFQNSVASAASPVPDKLIVLTFDDAVKSHLTFVAPILKELGFGATFFVTQRWMSDSTNFLNWKEIAELHRMGFEIG